jgi:excisionase family DNA binding protein
VAQDATPGDGYYITTDEAADRWSVHPETIKRLHRQRRITGYKVGRVLRWDPNELRDHFRSASRAGSPTPARATEPNLSALDKP